MKKIIILVIGIMLFINFNCFAKDSKINNEQNDCIIFINQIKKPVVYGSFEEDYYKMETKQKPIKHITRKKGLKEKKK